MDGEGQGVRLTPKAGFHRCFLSFSDYTSSNWTVVLDCCYQRDVLLAVLTSSQVMGISNESQARPTTTTALIIYSNTPNVRWTQGYHHDIRCDKRVAMFHPCLICSSVGEFTFSVRLQLCTTNGTQTSLYNCTFVQFALPKQPICKWL